MKVRAKDKGYYGHAMREAGEEFEIQSVKELGAWMEPLEATKPSVTVDVDLKKKEK